MVRPRPPPCCGAVYDLVFGLASASVCETVPAPRGGDCGGGRKVEGRRLRLWRMAVGGPLVTMPHARCRLRLAAGGMSFCDDPNLGYAQVRSFTRSYVVRLIVSWFACTRKLQSFVTPSFVSLMTFFSFFFKKATLTRGIPGVTPL